MNAARYLLAPLWVAQLATGAKSFADNPLIGSPRLNARGLHAARVRLSHRLAWARRARLARLVDSEARAAFDRDGFVEIRNFLSDDVFARLQAAALSYRGPAREMVQGDTITRRIAIDPAALAAIPDAQRLIDDPRWRGLNRYVGSFDSEPLTYIQTILARRREGPPDPQTHFHADTFHPTVKAWLFLTDVAEEDGPLAYVPGSHRLTPARIAWERAMSLRAAGADRLSSRGSFRIAKAELPDLGLPAPRHFAVPANTLVVADTFGFHARVQASRPSTRIEIWSYGRRSPFLPWTGLDPLSRPGLAERRIPLLWAARDRLAGIIGQPWQDVGLRLPGEE
jgi:hypothetical protein